MLGGRVVARGAYQPPGGGRPSGTARKSPRELLLQVIELLVSGSVPWTGGTLRHAARPSGEREGRGLSVSTEQGTLASFGPEMAQWTRDGPEMAPKWTEVESSRGHLGSIRGHLGAIRVHFGSVSGSSRVQTSPLCCGANSEIGELKVPRKSDARAVLLTRRDLRRLRGPVPRRDLQSPAARRRRRHRCRQDGPKHHPKIQTKEKRKL